MKAKILLLSDGGEIFERVFDWADQIETKSGMVNVSEISLYSDKPIIDGKECRIMNMFSAPKFYKE